MAVKLPSMVDFGARPAITPSTGVAGYTPQSVASAAEPGLAMSGLGGTITKVTNEAQDKINTAKAEDAYNALRNEQLALTIGEQGFANKKGGDALDGALIPTYNTRFEDAVKRIGGTLGSPDQQRMFQQRANISRLQYQTDLGNHVQRQDEVYQESVYTNTLATERRNAGANPTNSIAMDTSLARIDVAIDAKARRTGQTTNQWAENEKARERDLAWTARFDTWRTIDPVGALAEFQKIPDGQLSPGVRQRLGDQLYRDSKMLMASDPKVQAAAAAPPTQLAGAPGEQKPGSAGGTFDTAVKSLLKREGGYVASDGKSGAPANFGINQKANPDIDVKNLTEARAVEIYRERYWDKIGGDKLAPSTAMVAMDTAALQGVSVAKRLLEETGGDPLVMIARRREMLENLARDPEHAKNLPGWKKRLDGLEAEVKGMPAALQRQDTAATFATQMGLRDPSLPTGNPVVDALPPDQKLEVMAAARTLANQATATGRFTMDERVTDTRAAFRTTGDAPNAPTAGELVAVYGQERGPRLYEELQAEKRFGQVAQQVWNMSPQERVNLLAANQPDPKQPGYAEGLKRVDDLQRIMQQADRQRDHDPAAYAATRSPIAKAAFETLNKAIESKDPVAAKTAADRYAIATLAEQRRLGAANPQILTKGMADAMIMGFNSQEEGGQNAAQLVRAASETWGKHWNAVYDQVSEKLPPGALVIGAGMHGAPAELMARVTRMKREDLIKGLQTNDVKGVTDALPAIMAPLRETLAKQGDISTFSTYFRETEKLALHYVSEGKSPANAAQQAFSEVAGERYDFQPTYRVPRMHENVPVDIPAVKRGAAAVIPSIDTLLNVDNLMIPTSGMGLPVGATTAAYVSALKNQAYWATSQYEDGLTLMANGAQVTDKNRNPVTVSWDELAMFGQESAAPRARTGFGENAGGAATGVQRNPRRGASGGGEGGGGGERPENLVRPDRSPQRAADYDATVGGAPQRTSAQPPPSSGQTGLSNRPLNAQEAERQGDKNLRDALARRAAEDAKKKR